MAYFGVMHLPTGDILLVSTDPAILSEVLSAFTLIRSKSSDSTLCFEPDEAIFDPRQSSYYQQEYIIYSKAEFEVVELSDSQVTVLGGPTFIEDSTKLLAYRAWEEIQKDCVTNA